METAKNILNKSSEYKCKQCNHSSSNISPEIEVSDESKININSYTMKLNELREDLKSEISCVIKKTTFNETPLGFGVGIYKLNRTGEIKNLIISQEYLSLKAFTKQKIRKV